MKRVLRNVGRSAYAIAILAFWAAALALGVSLASVAILTGLIVAGQVV